MLRTGFKRAFSFGIGGLMAASLPVTQAHALVTFYNEGTTSGFFYRQNPINSWNVINYTDPARARKGSKALRFETRWGTSDSDSDWHSEVVKGGVQGKVAVKWYGFSTYIPSGYDRDRIVVFQLFDWSSGGSGTTFGPPLLFYTKNDGWEIAPHWDGNGKAEVKISNSIELDRYTDWVVQVQTNPAGGGWVRVWKNGVQLTGAGQQAGYAFRGRIGYNSTQLLEAHHGAYAVTYKYYRSQGRTPPAGPNAKAVVYVDQIRYGDANSSFAEVNPAQ